MPVDGQNAGTGSILLIEPGTGGHRMRYVARIVRGAMARGIDVKVISTPESMTHPYTESFRDSIRVEDLANMESIRTSFLLKFQFACYRAYRAWARKYPTDRVLIPWGDNVDKVFAVLGTGAGCWEVLLGRPFFHHAAMGVVGSSSTRGDALREWLFRLLIARRGIRRILTLDDLLPVYAQRQGWRGAEKIRFVPDPPHTAPPGDQRDARTRLGLPQDAPVLLVYGGLDSRKGIGDALVALAEGGEGSAILLLVGEQDEEVRALLQNDAGARLRDGGRLVEVIRYVDEPTEADAFAAADAVWLGYLEFQGSSGVLVQAAQADRPVVACAEGLIGWRTREYGLGAVLQGRNSASVLDALEKAIATRDDPLAKKQRRAFAQANSEAAFVDAILDI